MYWFNIIQTKNSFKFLVNQFYRKFILEIFASIAENTELG